MRLSGLSAGGHLRAARSGGAGSADGFRHRGDGAPLLGRGGGAFRTDRVIYPADGSSHFQLWRDNRDISWMHTRLVCRLLWDQLLRIGTGPAASAPGRRSCGASAHPLVAHPGRGSLLGMQIMLTSYRLLGRRGFSLLLYPVIGYFWLTGRAQRQASQAYLTRLESFADASGVTLPLSRDRAFATSCALARRRSTSWRAGAATSPSKRWNWWGGALPGGHQQRSGVLLLGSHLGDLELCRALGSRKQGLRINALVFTRHAARFNALLKQINPDSHLNLIQVQELGPIPPSCSRRNWSGEWVVIVGDRTSVTREKRVIWADFLGARRPFRSGPSCSAACWAARST